jgi:hypothetical protein
MATVTLRLSMTRPIPFGIFGLAMRIETAYIVAQLTPLLDSFRELRTEVSDLTKRCEIIGERVERAQNRVEDLMLDIQPLWNDAYNLCGDSACQGDCMICRDGEYLGEEDYEEKYCRRGKR